MSELWSTLDEHLPLFSPAPGAYRRVIQRARRRRQTRRRIIAAVAATALMLVVAVVVVTSVPTDRSLAAEVTIPIGGTPLQSVPSKGLVWVLTCDRLCSGTESGSSGRLVAVDARSATVISSFPVAEPSALAVGEGSVWLTHFWAGTVTRLDPATGRTLATIHLRLPRPFGVGSGDSRFLPGPLTAGQGGVWVTTARGYIARIDPTTNQVEKLIRVADEATGPLVTGQGGVWAADSLLGVLRINPNTNTASTINISSGARRLAVADVAVADGLVWATGTWARRSIDHLGHVSYTNTTQNAIAAVDTQTTRLVKVIALPSWPDAVFQSGGSLWIGGLWHTGRRTLIIYRFDLSKHRITHRYTIETTGSFVAVQDAAIWITTPQGDLHRIRYTSLPTN
jgi:streptogramin lyase